MTPTNDVRGRLNELGIEYDVTSDSCTTARIGGIEYKFMEYAIQGPSDGANGKVFIITDYLTPEQAIAATVGAGTCKGSFHKSSDLSSGRVLLYYCKDTNRSIFVEREAKVCPLCGGRIKEEPE